MYLALSSASLLLICVSSCKVTSVDIWREKEEEKKVMEKEESKEEGEGKGGREWESTQEGRERGGRKKCEGKRRAGEWRRGR